MRAFLLANIQRGCGRLVPTLYYLCSVSMALYIEFGRRVAGSPNWFIWTSWPFGMEIMMRIWVLAGSARSKEGAEVYKGP